MGKKKYKVMKKMFYGRPDLSSRMGSLFWTWKKSWKCSTQILSKRLFYFHEAKHEQK